MLLCGPESGRADPSSAVVSSSALDPPSALDLPSALDPPSALGPFERPGLKLRFANF